MFTSQSLLAIRPGQLAVKEQRLDDVVHLVDVRGELTPYNAAEISTRLDTALNEGVRWTLIDLTHVPSVDDSIIPWLVYSARVLRSRRGELIVAGAEPTVAQRLASYEVAHRPALAANVAQALMILKMLRPKTVIEPRQSKPKRITSLTLPRIEPSH